MKKTALFWSGGKDSALALYLLKNDPQVQVQCLVTTINKETERVSMHGIARSLIEAQSAAANLPVIWMEIAAAVTNEIYENSFLRTAQQLKQQGVNYLAFGDIFLEDLKNYRQNLADKAGMETIFPLWGIESYNVYQKFIQLNFKAITICIDTGILPGEALGTALDTDFLKQLPTDTDICGENGEYHTFVFEAPFFSKPISLKKGNSVEKFFSGSTKKFRFLDISLK